jgi:hypothetical protein
MRPTKFGCKDMAALVLILQLGPGKHDVAHQKPKKGWYQTKRVNWNK